MVSFLDHPNNGLISSVFPGTHFSTVLIISRFADSDQESTPLVSKDHTLMNLRH